MRPNRLVTALTTTIGLFCSATAAAPRALPEGQKPTDNRLKPPRTLNAYFPFSAVRGKLDWDQRAAELRRRVLVATGLWPEPTRTPLNAVIHGRVDRPEYTVERVFFESVPGHYVTGSLYRPKATTRPATIKNGRRPVVLCPHGHWSSGRFHDWGPDRVRREIAMGAERFLVGGRHPLQARCVQLARMGCIVFHYDMIGYADSIQFSEHRPGVRKRMATAKNWGFFSPQAEARLQNIMGLQTWNSVRAIDFVEELPDVDPERIGVTGGSGGGTQSFMIGAIDPRPAVFFPAVMVSTGMQGGCTCENAPLLRIGAGNIDLAALIAPRPLGLTSADDWTKELAAKGEPDLRKLYGVLGQTSHFQAFHFTHFKHNYNSVSRTAMYGWMNKHLKLGLAEPVLERDYQPLTRQELTVWNDQHPKPTGDQAGDAHERTLVTWLTQDAVKKLETLIPRDAASLKAYRRVVGGAFDTILRRRYSTAGKLTYDKPTEKYERGNYLLMTGVIDNTTHQEQIPLLFLHPAGNWNKTVLIWIDGAGKQALLDAAGEPNANARRLLNAGYSVMGIDLFGQGEWTDDGKPIQQTTMVKMYGGKKPWHHFAGYTYGYNDATFVRRVHDVLSAIRFVRTDRHGAKKALLLGVNGSGPVAAAALAQSDGAVAQSAIDTGGFRFSGLDSFDHPDFLPGGAKYQDLPGLLALCAPAPLWIGGEPADALTLPAAAYRAAGAHQMLTIAGKNAAVDAAVAWLLKQGR